MLSSPTPDASTPPLRSGFGCAMGVAALFVLMLGARLDTRRGLTLAFAFVLLLAIPALRRGALLDRAAAPVALLPLGLLHFYMAGMTPAGESFWHLIFDDLSFLLLPFAALLLAALGRAAARLLFARERPRLLAALRALAWAAATATAAALALSATRRPPLPYAALALVGLLFAIGLLLRGHRSLLPADGRLTKNALPLADGTLLFPDDTPQLPLPEGAEVGTDPVVAIFDVPPGAYREHARPRVTRVVPGTLAQHRMLAASTPHATALALIAITAAPLVAWLLG